MSLLQDPYLWLENLKNENTLKFVKKHAEKLKSFLGEIPSKLEPRIVEFFGKPYILSIKPTSIGLYFLVREKDSYGIKLIGDSEQLSEIVDSRDIGENVIITYLNASQDGKLLSFFYSIGGSDRGFLRTVKVPTLEVLDEIEGNVYNSVFVDEKSYLYVKSYRTEKPPDGVEPPTDRVFLRNFESQEEILVFGRNLPQNNLITLIESNVQDKVFALVEHGWLSGKVFTGLRSDPFNWRLVFDGKDCRVLPIGYYNENVFVICYDKGGKGRILKIDLSSKETIEVVGEDEYPLENGIIADNSIFATYLVNASHIIKVFDTNGKFLREIKISPQGSITYLRVFNGSLFFRYESFTVASRIYMLKEDKLKVLAEYCADNDIVIKEDWVESFDGTPIHVFVVEKQGVIKNNLAVVYGYGGFGVSVTPRYIGYVYPFIEDGGIFIVSNLRGGGEYGEEWHKAGMKENKWKVFEDFKAVLKYAKGKGFKTIAWGASNGGLLVATVLTQSPELLDAALIGYPLTDMLRFHKLYLGMLWTTEYGNPDDPKDREYLLNYSPYHNVSRAKRYPPVLIYTGLYDDRVHPGHAFKFAAKLEEVGAPVYLRIETTSGHLGSSPEIKIKEYSDILGFIYKVFALNVDGEKKI